MMNIKKTLFAAAALLVSGQTIAQQANLKPGKDITPHKKSRLTMTAFHTAKVIGGPNEAMARYETPDGLVVTANGADADGNGKLKLNELKHIRIENEQTGESDEYIAAGAEKPAQEIVTRPVGNMILKTIRDLPDDAKGDVWILFKNSLKRVSSKKPQAAKQTAVPLPPV